MSETPGSLLAKMTSDTGDEIRFDDVQVRNVMEILIPRMVTGLPGMPKGMECTVDRDDDGKGWTIRVCRP